VLGFVWLYDVGVRGLLVLLCGDVWIEMFVECELGLLFDCDDDFMGVLWVYFDVGCNKFVVVVVMYLLCFVFYDWLIWFG